MPPYHRAMSDPLNQLPTDPAWVTLADKLATEAAEKLQCMVVLVAVQPAGKMGVCVEGIPADGPLHEAAQDVPYLLELLAKTLRFADAVNAQAVRQ